MHGYGLKDAAKSATGALPGASTNSDIGDIDLEVTGNSDFVAGCELLVESPAVTTGELPDGDTLTVNVTQSDDSGFATEEVVANGVVLATGAGGAGAPAGEARVRLPTNAKRYIRVNVANSGIGDMSAKEATASLVF